jgi:hypothetical protein
VSRLLSVFPTLLLLGQGLRAFARGLVDVRGIAELAGRSVILLAAGIAVGGFSPTVGGGLAYWMFQDYSARWKP